MMCDDVNSFETEYSDSTAVFVGELVELKTVIIDTTHHGKKTYYTGRFRVLESWKTIDREFVSVDLPDTKSACTEFVEGAEYLVFAKQLGTSLYISTDSRSSQGSLDSARENLNGIGAHTVAVTRGEFSLEKNQSLNVGIVFLTILALLIGFLFLVGKKRWKSLF